MVDSVKKSKTLISSVAIKKLKFSPEMGYIFALGMLESSIEIYDKQLNFIRKVTPHECKEMKKNLPILSFFFSEQNKCLGCIVKDIGLVFWDQYDDYGSQKTIKVGNKTNIFYSKTQGKWLTIEGNTINIWNIKE